MTSLKIPSHQHRDKTLIFDTISILLICVCHLKLKYYCIALYGIVFKTAKIAFLHFGVKIVGVQ